MLRAHALIDRQLAVATTDPRLFGAFVEHLGRCIYGGLCEPATPRRRGAIGKAAVGAGAALEQELHRLDVVVAHGEEQRRM